jgi:hypothetical protein
VVNDDASVIQLAIIAGHILSVGTAKGNLLLYDSRIGKTMSILGRARPPWYFQPAL